MAILYQGSKVWTYELTNSSIVIHLTDAIKAVSIACVTTIGGTIQGDGVLQGIASGVINMTNSTPPITITTDTDGLNHITIIAPAGCTMQIMAIQN